MDIKSAAGLDEAKPGQVTFLANPHYTPRLKTTQASAIYVGETVDLGRDDIVSLRARDPYLAYTRALRIFHPELAVAPSIHPAAVIDPTARLAANDQVAPDQPGRGRASIAAGGSGVGARAVGAGVAPGEIAVGQVDDTGGVSRTRIGGSPVRGGRRSIGCSAFELCRRSSCFQGVDVVHRLAADPRCRTPGLDCAEQHHGAQHDSLHARPRTGPVHHSRRPKDESGSPIAFINETSTSLLVTRGVKRSQRPVRNAPPALPARR